MMRKFILLAFAVVSPAAFAQFYANGLAVTSVGDGSASLSNAATQTSVRSYDKTNTSQAGQNVVTFNSASSGQRLTNGGSTISEGSLSISTNGQFINLIGYDAAAGTAAVGTTTSAANNRMVASIDASGNSTLTNFTDAFSGAAARSVVSDGTGFWMAGSSNGQRYGTSGTSTVISTTFTNTRVINSFGGDLYYSVASTTNGIMKISGLPTASGNVATTLFSTAGSGTGTADPYGFWFKDANTVYVADNRSTANGGGIQKWSFSGSSWSLAYTLSAGGTTGGARYVTGEVNGSGGVDIFATTSETANNRLIKITDAGASSTSADLAFAGTNKAFRGVTTVPVPEPASMIAFGLGVAGFLAKRRKK